MKVWQKLLRISKYMTWTQRVQPIPYGYQSLQILISFKWNTVWPQKWFEMVLRVSQTIWPFEICLIIYYPVYNKADLYFSPYSYPMWILAIGGMTNNLRQIVWHIRNLNASQCNQNIWVQYTKWKQNWIAQDKSLSSSQKTWPDGLLY